MAKNWDSFLSHCKRNLNTFDAKEHQVFCFPHTMNICTGHIMSSLSSSPIDREPHKNHVVPGEQMYEQALARDPIAMARAAIRAIWVSGVLGVFPRL